MVSHAPGKKAAESMSSGVGASPPSSTKPLTRVVPTCMTSGTSPVAMAVLIFSVDDSHGTGVTFTVTSGLSVSNCSASSGSSSPSVPIAHTSTVPVAGPSVMPSVLPLEPSAVLPPSSLRPHPVRARARVRVDAVAAATRRGVLFTITPLLNRVC